MKPKKRGGARKGAGRPKTGRKRGVTSYFYPAIIASLGGYQKVRAIAEAAVFSSINKQKKVDLQKQFEDEFGISCVNSEGEPELDYVLWLEKKICD